MLFRKLVPDVVTYNALIDGCCKTLRMERALELFDDMKRSGVKGVEMLREMQRLGDGVASSSLYTPIIHALCEARRVVEACGFLVELVEGGSMPREYTYGLVCDARPGRVVCSRMVMVMVMGCTRELRMGYGIGIGK